MDERDQHLATMEAIIEVRLLDHWLYIPLLLMLLGGGGDDYRASHSMDDKSKVFKELGQSSLFQGARSVPLDFWRKLQEYTCSNKYCMCTI
ncbi:hypothetical protein V2J09_001074 [Rumex salicifolius]